MDQVSITKIMREYKIIKSDLGWNIYKKQEKDWKLSIWFLGWGDKWTLRKDYARTFYHREDAVSALVVMKKKDEKNTD